MLQVSKFWSYPILFDCLKFLPSIFLRIVVEKYTSKFSVALIVARNDNTDRNNMRETFFLHANSASMMCITENAKIFC